MKESYEMWKLLSKKAPRSLNLIDSSIDWNSLSLKVNEKFLNV